MKKLKSAILGLVLATTALSCATDGDNYRTDFSDESFKAWMAKYAPNATAHEDGYYIEYHRRATNWESLPKINSDSSWIRTSYTGYNLTGTVFTTRDSITAQWEGIETAKSRFVEDYIFYGTNLKFCTGVNRAVSDMRVGDSASIYVPSTLGYSTAISGNTPYQVATTSFMGLPIRMEISLSAINNKPLDTELERLNAWVAENWGMTEADTLKKGFYMRKLVELPDADTVSVDSTTYYFYESRFLDGQLFDTNVQSVAKENGYFSYDVNYSVATVLPTDYGQSERTYSVYPDALMEMNHGEKAEVAVISAYGAGNYGNSTSTPQILPFEPMVFTIQVEEREEDEEEDGNNEDEQ